MTQRIVIGLFYGMLLFGIALLLAAITPAPAHATAFSCATVKEFSWLGADRGRALAKSFGYTVTPKDEAKARACLSPTVPQAHKAKVIKKVALHKDKVIQHASATVTVTEPQPVASTLVPKVAPKRVPHAPPVAPSVPVEEPAMFSATHVVQAFAVFGLLAFTFCVGKYGLVPVYTKIKSVFAAGASDVSVLEARVAQLEALVKTPQPVQPAPAPAPVVVAPVSAPVSAGGATAPTSPVTAVAAASSPPVPLPHAAGV